MGDLSAHFSRAEFRDHRDGSLPAGLPTAHLVACLERLRHIIGDRPITIVSGYRTSANNRAVGGAPNSRHLFGDAADVAPGTCTVGQAIDAGFIGIGVDREGRPIHLDTRPGARVIFHDGWS